VTDRAVLARGLENDGLAVVGEEGFEPRAPIYPRLMLAAAVRKGFAVNAGR